MIYYSVKEIFESVSYIPRSAAPDHLIISFKIDMLDFANYKDSLEINACEAYEASYDFPYNKKY